MVYFSTHILQLCLKRNEPRKVINKLINSKYTTEEQSKFSLTGHLALGSDCKQRNKTLLSYTLVAEINGNFSHRWTGGVRHPPLKYTRNCHYCRASALT